MSDLKDKREEKLANLEDVRKALAKLDNEEKVLKGRIRELRNDADREDNADRIEAIRAKRDRIQDRREELEARQGKLSAKIKRLHKRIKARARKLRRKKYYASPHFRYAEFDCRNGTKVPRAAYPALRAHCRDILEPLRAKYGVVHVNSGYRTAAYNASVGGATNSIHIYDQHPGAVAVDHTSEGAAPSTVADFEEPLADGLGRYATFTHADNRCRIGWPKSRWYG